MSKDASELLSRHKIMSLIVVVVSSYILSVSVGMNLVVFPTSLSAYGANSTVIGTVMAMEFVSVFLISFYLPKMLRFLEFRTILILATLCRIPALVFLTYFADVPAWLALVFLHGLGNFLFMLLLQTWLNSIPFERGRGLAMSLLGTSMSLGLASGPVLLQFDNLLHLLADPIMAHIDGWIANGLDMTPAAGIAESMRVELFASMVISTVALVPVLLVGFLIPRFKMSDQGSLLRIVRLAPATFWAVAVCGVSILGVQSFIVVYGLQNGLSLANASLLLTAFMLGSIALETPIAWLSDFFDRRYVMITGILLSLVGAVYLPIAIYTPVIAWTLLFIWGGVIGGLYSVCLAMTAERFEGEDLVTANAAFSVMDNAGGIAGILMIGIAMDVFGPDGLPYVVMFAGVLYFSYALTRYRID